ncbi:MAG TPA: PEP-CTERM sorting domain-containing protein [Pirellulaceae bacterium]|nr:PEP-CTERM sorting domain-containing protein [Pirellulaceae bacterium]HMO91648.1 PEP-CTERM sorting domain-containing protein [Pirellulaceae bacterium]HMP68345.1 PEP-CTERM sorting domain-containing protein [Pirellulaceae bacterium]
MRRYLLNLATFTVLSFCVTGLAQADFVNGGFESGDFTGWTITPTANGQTNVQTVVLWDIDWGGPLPPSLVGRFQVGQQVFQSGVPAGIELTQSLVLSAGVEYTFSFDWSAHRATTASANTQGGIFDLIVNGNVLASAAAGPTSSTTQNFGNISVAFTPLVSGNYDVGARITRPFTVPADLFQSVDNFSATAIPEPTHTLIFGLVCLALNVRRQRK